jgi:hypothetical protein
MEKAQERRLPAKHRRDQATMPAPTYSHHQKLWALIASGFMKIESQ